MNRRLDRRSVNFFSRWLSQNDIDRSWLRALNKKKHQIRLCRELHLNCVRRISITVRVILSIDNRAYMSRDFDFILFTCTWSIFTSSYLYIFSSCDRYSHHRLHFLLMLFFHAFTSVLPFIIVTISDQRVVFQQSLRFISINQIELSVHRTRNLSNCKF